MSKSEGQSTHIFINCLSHQGSGLPGLNHPSTTDLDCCGPPAADVHIALPLG